MKSKTFLIIFLGIVIPIVGINCLIHFFYYDKFTGDLGRLSQIDFGKSYDYSFKNELEKNVYFEGYTLGEDHKYFDSQYDIVTIGDSFSQGGKNGYQNYLAKMTGWKIFNLTLYEFYEPDQTAVILLNSGFFDKNPPKFLIIESVERYFLDRSTDLDLKNKHDLEKITNYYKKKKRKIKKEEPIFHTKKFKFLAKKMFIKNTFDDKVFHAYLNQKLFRERSEELYCYSADIKNIKKNVPEYIDITRKNYEEIFNKCAKKGIVLIVLPAANKYTIYQDYIINRITPKSDFWDKYPLSNFPYIFINTEIVLSNALRSGIKDIYLMNDTHWSYIGHKLVAKEIAKKIAEWDKCHK